MFPVVLLIKYKIYFMYYRLKNILKSVNTQMPINR